MATCVCEALVNVLLCDIRECTYTEYFKDSLLLFVRQDIRQERLLPLVNKQ